MSTTSRPNYDHSTLRRLAVEAEVDPRSVQRELRQPGSVRGMPGHRIRYVLQARGLIATSSSSAATEA